MYIYQKTENNHSHFSHDPKKYRFRVSIHLKTPSGIGKKTNKEQQQQQTHHHQKQIISPQTQNESYCKISDML